MRTAAVLVAVDAVVAALVLTAAMWFREVLAPAWLGIAPFSPAVSYLTLWPVILLNGAVRAAFGLYPGHGVSDVAQLRNQTLGTVLVAATVLAGGALFRFDQDYSRVVLVTWFAALAVVLPLVRAGTRWVLSSRPWFGVSVHVVSAGLEGGQVGRLLASRPALGLRPVGADAPASAAVLGLSDVDNRRWDELAVRYPRVWVITHGWIAAMPASVTTIDDRVALELRSRLLEPVNRVVKRSLDLALVLTTAPFMLVLCMVIAVAVRLDGPGPILIRHERVGRGGRTFRVLKFRTMVPDAEARLQHLLATDPKSADEWRRTQKLRQDPRVTRLGRWLRATSLDEVPQVWNVVVGEMSWVGPRPVVPNELGRYGVLEDLYLRVLPGITGLVQVSGRSDLAYERRVELDAFYVRNWSIWMDFVILARTVEAVGRRRGAV